MLFAFLGAMLTAAAVVVVVLWQWLQPAPPPPPPPLPALPALTVPTTGALPVAHPRPDDDVPPPAPSQSPADAGTRNERPR